MSLLEEFDQDIARLEVRTDLQRKSDFLKPLVVGLIVLQLIALVVMLVPPYSSLWGYFVIIGSSLVVNSGIFYLNQRGSTQPAAHLFCHNFNIFIFFFVLANLIVEEEIATAVLVGYLLALTVLLGGMLISHRAIFGFAGLNIALIFIPIFIISDTLGEALAISFSIIGFLSLITIVSWLYQSTLDQAQVRLSTARQQLMKTRLMQRDLKIAQNLQRELYPPPPPVGPYLTIACRSEPARETSGDLYDFIKLDTDQWGIVVADVTGKSLPAALIMTMTRSILRNEVRRHASPAKVLQQANVVLHDDATVDQMVTALYGILNTKTLTFRFANAGQLHPTLKHNGQVMDVELNGLPLKGMPQANYEELSIQLRPGDQLVLSSDGLVEATNPQHKIFGFERWTEMIGHLKTTDPDQIIQEIWSAVEIFRGEGRQRDDMTLVVIAVKDQEVKAKTLQENAQVVAST